jgi:uncharacterized protein YndB with AHSA1/START domain
VDRTQEVRQIDVAEPAAKRSSTRVSMIVKAGRELVYRAFLDPDATAVWLPPDGMTGEVHFFDASEGGRFRISLTYRDPGHRVGGKSSEHTDTFQGRFVELAPYEKIVEAIEFETDDPSLAGEMKLTVTFAEAGPATEVTILSEDIPRGIRLEDNQAGVTESLRKLAVLVEALGDSKSVD